MMCLNPYKQGVAEYGCGRCMPCSLNRKRLWTARLMLEYAKHEASFFVTLTYNKEHLPCNNSVSVRHAQLYLKNMRTRISPTKMRYYMVGEYGDLSKRPHYHLALFGKVPESVIRECWHYGHVHVGSLTQQSAAYVVSYIVKHMTKKEDARLEGRAPEFALMSRKPGLGCDSMDEMAAILSSKGGVKYVVREGDVPTVFRTEGKKWPLGRYLRRKLREKIGMEAGAPEPVVERMARTLQAELREPGGLKLREDRRLHAGRKAAVIQQITRSKKGIGL